MGVRVRIPPPTPTANERFLAWIVARAKKMDLSKFVASDKIRRKYGKKGNEKIEYRSILRDESQA